jgi:hypothetical protein
MGTTALVLLHVDGNISIFGKVLFGIPNDTQRSETELWYEIPFSEPLIIGRLYILNP